MRFIGRQSAKALPRGLFSRLPLFRMGKRWKSTALPWQTRFTEKRFGQQAGREARTWIRLQSGQVKSCTCRRQGGRDPLTGRQASDFPGEVRQALDNVSTVLKAARLSMKNVLWVNPYMSVGGQYDVMGKIYASYFEFGNTPGRGTIQVVGLPKGDHIVFSCIAGADLSKRKAIRPRNMPPSPTASPGILYGDTLYLSAKDGFIPDQGIVTPDLELQLRQSMRNLLDGLQEADMDFSDVVFSTVYLRQIQDADRVNAIYGKFFEGRYPARSVLQQNFEVHDEAAEQISFIAVKHSPTVERKAYTSRATRSWAMDEARITTDSQIHSQEIFC